MLLYPLVLCIEIGYFITTSSEPSSLSDRSPLGIGRLGGGAALQGFLIDIAEIRDLKSGTRYERQAFGGKN